MQAQYQPHQQPYHQPQMQTQQHRHLSYLPSSSIVSYSSSLLLCINIILVVIYLMHLHSLPQHLLHTFCTSYQQLINRLCTGEDADPSIDTAQITHHNSKTGDAEVTNRGRYRRRCKGDLEASTGVEAETETVAETGTEEDTRVEDEQGQSTTSSTTATTTVSSPPSPL